MCSLVSILVSSSFLCEFVSAGLDHVFEATLGIGEGLLLSGTVLGVVVELLDWGSNLGDLSVLVGVWQSEVIKSVNSGEGVALAVV